MSDPDKFYANGHLYDDDLTPSRARKRRGGPLPTYEKIPVLDPPPGRLNRALLIGLIAGLIWAAEGIFGTLLSSSGRQNALQVSVVVGTLCLTIFIGLFICVIAGYISGRLLVQRSLGFITGFVAGLVTYGIHFLLNYVPGYPDRSPLPSNVGSAEIIGSLLFALVLFLLSGAICGLFGLLGAWLATRTHPYYFEETREEV